MKWKSKTLGYTRYDWFAWYPVPCSDATWRWFETVQVVRHSWQGKSGIVWKDYYYNAKD